MQRAAYDIDLLREDITGKGWKPSDLVAEVHRAQRKKRVKTLIAPSTVYRFLSGAFQTAPTAKLISEALGHPADHYLIRRAA